LAARAIFHQEIEESDSEEARKCQLLLAAELLKLPKLCQKQQKHMRISVAGQRALEGMLESGTHGAMGCRVLEFGLSSFSARADLIFFRLQKGKSNST